MFGIAKQTAPAERGVKVYSIGIDDIRRSPYQPRQVFDEEAIGELSESIREMGILQPVTVRPLEDGKYELISGERRLRAARMAGLARIPCIIREENGEFSALMGLIENLQRQDLNCFEEAEAIERMSLLFGLSQEEIAKKIGKSQSAVANKLRLLRLPGAVRVMLTEHGMTERHARALLRLEGERQLKAAKQAAEQKMNVAQTEALVERMLREEPKKPGCKGIVRDVRIFVNTINHALDVMRGSGIPAESSRSESERYIEYHIRIPKVVR